MKSVTYNPYLPPVEFVPDGEPHVFDGRVYLYGSHDERNGNDYCLGDYVCWSAPVEDLSKWRLEGTIYRKDQDPKNPDGSRKMNAPDVARGPDGRYYLYYFLTVQKWSQLEIAVAVCDTPAGKYEYLGVVRFADGRILDTPLAFDPAVLVDTDGRVWLYFGFAPHFPMRGQPIPETLGAYCVELEPDMMTCKGEPVNILPDFNHAVGTEFEAHPFFEASSIRKIGDRYYFVYCSRAMHELCYATSQYPNRDFHFGGVVISNCDVGYHGRTTAEARNQIANVHGGMFEAQGQWYINYHRHTNGTQFSRQGCMEPITIREDGFIEQVECTSFGLSGGCIPAKGTIPAWCACNQYKGKGGCFIKFGPRSVDGPYVVAEEVEGVLESYVSNITDDSLVGYRYLAFDGSETTLTLRVKGEASGIMTLFLSDDDSVSAGSCQVSVQDSDHWTAISMTFRAVTGKHPLRLRYAGLGMLELGQLTIE